MRRTLLASTAFRLSALATYMLVPHQASAPALSASPATSLGSSSALGSELPSATPTPSATTETGITPSSGSSSSSSPTPTAPAASTVYYTGDSVDARYGMVQVKIGVKSGKLVSVDVLSAPDGDPHSQSISSQVIPVLKSQALAAQSANISGVSGATFTSNGFAQSLASAIAQVK